MTQLPRIHHLCFFGARTPSRSLFLVEREPTRKPAPLETFLFGTFPHGRVVNFENHPAKVATSNSSPEGLQQTRLPTSDSSRKGTRDPLLSVFPSGILARKSDWRTLHVASRQRQPCMACGKKAHKKKKKRLKCFRLGLWGALKADCLMGESCAQLFLGVSQNRAGNRHIPRRPRRPFCEPPPRSGPYYGSSYVTFHSTLQDRSFSLLGYGWLFFQGSTPFRLLQRETKGTPRPFWDSNP